MTGDPIDRTLVQPAAEDARDERSHRLLYLAGALVVVGVAGLAAWAWFSIRGLHDEVAAATVHADTATSSAQQLYEQVKRLGGTPVVAPPAQGATGATGATGAQGIPGRDGPQGVAGQSPACLATASQCQGADGKPGADGPQGVPGATGPAGKDGAQGADGKPGADGAPGKDGPPGVSVTRVYFDRNDAGECRTYNDFSDGRTKVDEGPAGEAACAPAKNPTPPAVLPTGTTYRRRYT